MWEHLQWCLRNNCFSAESSEQKIGKAETGHETAMFWFYYMLNQQKTRERECKEKFMAPTFQGLG